MKPSVSTLEATLNKSKLRWQLHTHTHVHTAYTERHMCVFARCHLRADLACSRRACRNVRCSAPRFRTLANVPQKAKWGFPVTDHMDPLHLASRSRPLLASLNRLRCFGGRLRCRWGAISRLRAVAQWVQLSTGLIDEGHTHTHTP